MAAAPAPPAKTYVVGPPTAAVVPPGECVFGEEWMPAPLVAKVPVSHDTQVFTFGLPDPSKGMGLSTCACILARGGADEEGNPVIRPYTPVSTNAMLGQFELMVKVYPDGKLSQHLDHMAVGDTLDFKHIPFNVKTQYPFGKKHLGVLVGGTGITPIIQALHAVLGTEGDDTKVTLLFGNKTQQDILAKPILDEWAAAFPERLEVVHVLSNEPEGSDWDGPRGFISKDLMDAHIAKPADDVVLFICGPPPMYTALCGPRDQPELTGLLADLGYSAEQVFKF